MPSPSIVRARGVSKYYGKKEVLQVPELDLEASKVFVLVGPNGSGKTTLMKALAGLVQVDEGEIRIFDEVIRPEHEVFRQKVGFLFDHSTHWEVLSGWDNAWFFARSLRLSAREASESLDRLFGAMGMEGVRTDPVRTYSYGMRRKLSIIESLVHSPKLLFMDEPAIGLDLSSRLKLYEMLRSAARDGAAALISTNDLNEARALADEVLLMDQGRILAKGSPETLVRSLNRSTVIEVETKVPFGAERLSWLDGVQSASSIEQEGRFVVRVLVRSEGEEETLGRIIQTIAASGPIVLKVSVRRPELGDVFLSYVGRDAHQA